jgi:hypothetical protein
MPEASSNGDQARKAEATKRMLQEWNEALQRLSATLTDPDADRPLVPYGDALEPGDRHAIPDFDLPAGAPPWWSSVRQWATRKGDDAEAKRATIEVVVPPAERPWR